MLGVPGLDPIGLVHALFASGALVLGLSVLLGRKGTRRHRRLGRLYLLAMVLLNATALMIYDLFGGFGPFHWGVFLSVAMLGAGFVPVFMRRPRESWTRLHATFMCWSYLGLVAAFLSEIAVRVPGLGFGPAVIAATGVTVIVGGMLIHTRVPPIAAAFAKTVRNDTLGEPMNDASRPQSG